MYVCIYVVVEPVCVCMYVCSGGASVCVCVCSGGASVCTCVCIYAVVEQMESSASLYSRSIQAHHVCLLVKLLVSISAVSVSATHAGNFSYLSGLLHFVSCCLS